MSTKLCGELYEVIQARKSVDSTTVDEVYEEIDAPKFFDFTVPDRSRPDSRSWFCARIGCEEVHEEVDLDALSKSFLQRVMAARSPNVRHRKALDRQAPSLTSKCPRSAPAKSTQNTIVRLSTMTSLPEKIAQARLKDHPISNLTSACTRVQPSIGKEALTALRSQTSLANQEGIQSMRHQKEPVVEAKKKIVAKVVSFAPSNTSINIATKEGSDGTGPSKCNGPAPEVCTDKKKLKASRRMKNVPSRYLCISTTLKRSKRDEDSANTTKKGKETKNTTMLGSETSSKLNETKADKGLDRKSATALSVNSSKKGKKLKSEATTKLCNPIIRQECSHGNSNNMEVDRELGGQSGTAAKDEEHIPFLAVNSAKRQECSHGNSNNMEVDRELGGQSGTAAKDEEHIPFLAVNSAKECLESAEVKSRNLNNSNIMKNCEKDREKVPLMCDAGKSDVGAQKNELLTDIDGDKENTSYTNLGRLVSLNTQNHASENSTSANREDVPQKSLKPKIKSSIEPSDRGKRAKTTNPRPFRLRVDERKILKDANQESKLQIEAQAQKKTKTNRRLGDATKTVVPEVKTTAKIQSGLLKQLSRRILEHKSMTASRKPLDDNSGTVSTAVPLKGRTSSRKPLDPKLARDNRSERATPVLKGRTKSRKSVDPKIARKNQETVAAAVTMNGRRRPVTVPKEPNFHKIHLPKDCSKLVEVLS